jgi:hypothetical protein
MNKLLAPLYELSSNLNEHSLRSQTSCKFRLSLQLLIHFSRMCECPFLDS